MTKTYDQFLDPSKIAEDLVTKLKWLAIPGVDVEAVMATQRKNIEALANASRTTWDGAQAIGKRQAEILQETMNHTAGSLEALAKAGTPLDIATRQASLMKEGFETALRSMRELAEMVSKAQLDAVGAIGDRVVQSLHELNRAAPQPATDAAAVKTPPTAKESVSH